MLCSPSHPPARAPVRALALTALAALAGTAGCDITDDGVTDPLDVGNVVVTPGRVLMTAHGDTRSLTAAVLDDSDAAVEGAEVTWATTDAGVGTVDSAGVVTAVGDGTALIRATAGGVTGEAGLTVQAGGGAPVVYGNGVVITVDPVDRVEEAVIVHDGRIFTTGATTDLQDMLGSEAVEVDLAGATVMPGFVDPHNHTYNTIFQGKVPELGTTYAEAEQRLIELGMTTIGNANVWPDATADFMTFVDSGVRLRTNIYLGYNDICGNVWPADWYLEYPPITDPEARFRIPGIKIFSDGGACNRAAMSFFSDGGDLYFNVDELVTVVNHVSGHGYQAAIHALGDIAVDTVIAALDSVLDGGPNTPRYRMEHNRYLRDRQLTLYSVGAIPVVFGYPFTCQILDGGEWSFLNDPTFEPLRPRLDRWRDLIDANPDLPIAWKSDAPIAGPIAPLENLWSLVTRNGVRDDGSLCDAPTWLEAGAVTVPEALEMMTVNSAYALGMDSVIGSLAEGKLADLVVLSDDPRTVPHEDLRTLEVWMTMIDGVPEYCAAGFEALCPDP